MGRRIRCPSCPNEFYLHGNGNMPGEEAVTCYECGTIFNPRKQSRPPKGGE